MLIKLSENNLPKNEIPIRGDTAPEGDIIELEDAVPVGVYGKDYLKVIKLLRDNRVPYKTLLGAAVAMDWPLGAKGEIGIIVLNKNVLPKAKEILIRESTDLLKIL